MAFTFSTEANSLPSTGPVAMYLVISTLLAAGWTMPDASDGTTRAANQVTTGASGTGGLGNNSAWVRMKAPAVTHGSVTNQQREFTLQRGTTDLVYRIKTSASAGFTGGSPSATQTPSAADEVFHAGGGTDAAPTYLAATFPANGTYRFRVMAGGAAELYSFLVDWETSATTTCLGYFFLDVMATGHPGGTLDVDPAVWGFSNASGPFGTLITNNTAANVTNPALARAWLGATSAAGAATTGTNNQYVLPMTHGNNGSAVFINASTSMGTNPFTLKDDLIPVLWGRPGAAAPPTGFKGASTLFSWGTIVRTTQETNDVAATRDHRFLNGFWVPCSGNAPAV